MRVVVARAGHARQAVVAGRVAGRAADLDGGGQRAAIGAQQLRVRHVRVRWAPAVLCSTAHMTRSCVVSDEESNTAAYSNGRKFLYNSKGLDIISLLVKYYVPFAHINKVIKLLKFNSAMNTGRRNRESATE